MRKLSILAMFAHFISLFLPGLLLGQVADNSIEEIFVVRSVRESRVDPTEFCEEAKIQLGTADVEDQYTFRSIASGSDGLIINANVQTVGRIHTCFGATADPALSFFYAEGSLGTVTFTGLGECRQAWQDYPEPGIVVHRCFLELSDLPKDYVGGQLTTNSVNSQTGGEKSDPPGYTQSSIATIRLWKRR